MLIKTLLGANRPKLSSAMVPVKWDGTTWIVTDQTDKEWFDYNEKKWANVMLKDGLKVEGVADASIASLKEMKDKKVIKEGSMFVWIPRFAYQITNGYHKNGKELNESNSELGVGTIRIEFMKGKKNVRGRTSFHNESGENNWNIHPAFDYNGAVEGIWVAKFEASHEDCTTDASTGEDTSETPTSRRLQIKPGITSWRNISIWNATAVCGNYNISLNSHLMKNTEWGAIVYLAQSNYGIEGKIEINNSDSFITGASIGENAVGTQNDYTSELGVKASTTGNVYGVYDMSGGSWEYVAAYLNETSSAEHYGNSLINAQSYNKNVYQVGQENTKISHYEANSNVYGDAMYETSNGAQQNNAWYSNNTEFADTASIFFLRGGMYNSGAGVYSFSSTTNAVNAKYSFRPTLIVK